MANTYFANDLSGLQQAQLQDQGQQMAADANRRQTMTDLQRINAERYRTQQEAAARMYQTQAYRDVGMRGEDVRQQLGLGDIGLRGELGRGDIALRGELGRGQLAGASAALASQERMATMPYEKMTAFQAAEVQRQKDQLQLMKDNPGLYMQLFGDPRMRQEVYQQQVTRDEAKRAALAANMNLARRGGVDALKAEISNKMDSYGGMTHLWGDSSGLWSNPLSDQAGDAAKAIATGTALPSSVAGKDAVKSASDYFQNELEGTAKGLEAYRPYIYFDNVSGQWKSKYDMPGGPLPNHPGAGLGNQPTGTNALTNPIAQPLVTTNGVNFPSVAGGGAFNTPPGVIGDWIPGRGLILTPPSTNAPPQ